MGVHVKRTQLERLAVALGVLELDRYRTAADLLAACLAAAEGPVQPAAPPPPWRRPRGANPLGDENDDDRRYRLGGCQCWRCSARRAAALAGDAPHDDHRYRLVFRALPPDDDGC